MWALRNGLLELPAGRHYTLTLALGKKQSQTTLGKAPQWGLNAIPERAPSCQLAHQCYKPTEGSRKLWLHIRAGNYLHLGTMLLEKYTTLNTRIMDIVIRSCERHLETQTSEGSAVVPIFHGLFREQAH